MTFVVSDIHGEYELFVKLLEGLRFDGRDTLLVLGDMIDKGTDSIRLVNLLRQMPNARCIVGNHEYAFLKHYWGLLQQNPSNFDELLATLQEYFPQDRTPLTWEIIDWLETLPYYIETDDYIAVHSGVPVESDGTLRKRQDIIPEQFVYDRYFKDKTKILPTEKCVLFGHTPVRNLTGKDDILVTPKAGQGVAGIRNLQKVHLDTGVTLSGVLGCFCIDTCSAYYVTKE